MLKFCIYTNWKSSHKRKFNMLFHTCNYPYEFIQLRFFLLSLIQSFCNLFKFTSLNAFTNLQTRTDMLYVLLKYQDSGSWNKIEKTFSRTEHEEHVQYYILPSLLKIFSLNLVHPGKYCIVSIGFVFTKFVLTWLCCS